MVLLGTALAGDGFANRVAARLWAHGGRCPEIWLITRGMAAYVCTRCTRQPSHSGLVWRGARRPDARTGSTRTDGAGRARRGRPVHVGLLLEALDSAASRHAHWRRHVPRTSPRVRPCRPLLFHLARPGETTPSPDPIPVARLRGAVLVLHLHGLSLRGPAANRRDRGRRCRPGPAVLDGRTNDGGQGCGSWRGRVVSHRSRHGLDHDVGNLSNAFGQTLFVAGKPRGPDCSGRVGKPAGHHLAGGAGGRRAALAPQHMRHPDDGADLHGAPLLGVVRWEGLRGAARGVGVATLLAASGSSPADDAWFPALYRTELARVASVSTARAFQPAAFSLVPRLAQISDSAAALVGWPTVVAAGVGAWRLYRRPEPAAFDVAPARLGRDVSRVSRHRRAHADRVAVSLRPVPRPGRGCCVRLELVLARMPAASNRRHYCACGRHVGWHPPVGGDATQGPHAASRLRSPSQQYAERRTP